jgi:hypothetical protein
VVRSTEHPVPRAITAPSIPELHPTKTLHPRTSPYHMYPPQVSHMGNAQVAPPRQDLSSRLVVKSCLVDSTLTTHPRLTPRSPHVHYHVIIRLSTPRALSRYASHSSASHHPGAKRGGPMKKLRGPTASGGYDEHQRLALDARGGGKLPTWLRHDGALGARRLRQSGVLGGSPTPPSPSPCARCVPRSCERSSGPTPISTEGHRRERPCHGRALGMVGVLCACVRSRRS